MGVGAGLYMYDVVVKTFTFAISSTDEFLSTAGPQLYNSLPEDVQSASSLTIFRRQLKHYLFRQSYPDIVL